MYRSKDAGRNAVTVFDTSMLERVARRVELERRLRQALSAGQIVAYYQPLVQLPSGNVVGFEALARWENDEQMVASSEFIPVAEESGLIVPLGAYMVDEACRSLAHWRRTIPGGEQLYVSVNLSPRQVRESDIVDIVAEALLRHGLPGTALWLEITESVMMEDSVSTAGVMVGLRSLGVRLSVDDFGTGFSSLSTLKRFPVSGVKIDRSFVSGLGQHQSDSSLVAAIVAMASALRSCHDRRRRRDARPGGSFAGARLHRGAGVPLRNGSAVRRSAADRRPSRRCRARGASSPACPDNATAELHACVREARVPWTRGCPGIGSGSSADVPRLAVEDLDRRTWEVVGDLLGQPFRTEHLAIEVTDVEDEHSTHEGGYLPQLGGQTSEQRAAPRTRASPSRRSRRRWCFVRHVPGTSTARTRGRSGARPPSCW